MQLNKTIFNPSTPIANIGMGVMGTKVAWACAKSGMTTQVYDVEFDRAVKSRELAISWSEGDDREIVAQNMRVCETLEESLDGVQLAFENVPERLELKTQVLSQIDKHLDQSAFMGTNASALLCSPLAQASGRPDSFFNLNFTDPRTSQLVELMTCELTHPDTVTFAKAWSRAIGMVPIWTPKEQLGYSFNRLWRVIKSEVLRQIDQGYATPESIDRAWMLIFNTDSGPCGLMDEVGLHSVLAVEKIYFEDTGNEVDRPPQILVDHVERGDFGVVSGRGFYEYPDPEYRKANFLHETEDSEETIQSGDVKLP